VQLAKTSVRRGNPLWAGYLTFYKTTLAQEISDTAWARFHDLDEPLFALGGYVDGRLMGFAHYLFIIVRPGRATVTVISRICTCRKMRAAVASDTH